MRRQLRRDVRVLRYWAFVSTALLLFVSSVVVFSQAQRTVTRFDEISVERINVVERDGSVRLVIANGTRQADAVIDGRVIVSAIRRLSAAARDRHRPGVVLRLEQRNASAQHVRARAKRYSGFGVGVTRVVEAAIVDIRIELDAGRKREAEKTLHRTYRAQNVGLHRYSLQ